MTHKPAIRMLVLIISHKDVKKAHTILETHNSPVQDLCIGEGAATNEVMDYLGLGTTEKALLFCPVLKSQVPTLFEALGKGLGLHKPNKGCVFTFPISGASSYIMKILASEMPEQNQAFSEREEKKMSHEAKHSLLMVTINQGFSEEVMIAATAAGASGGTVVHARRLESQETMRKWGISVQPEKEMVYLLVEQDKKKAVMQAIGEQCGLLSDAQGIIICIPVDGVVGLPTNLPHQ
ncbi:transposase [Enterococcus pseudoavium]|uniref:transposase n=1 Tax=Enterococcus pseudoavium TaxID=44007 RepID=UPI00082B25E9|nr:transposase [Enterococcus pseudoavium]